MKRHTVALSSNSPHLRRPRPLDVMLRDEIFDWLQTNAGPRDSGAWCFDSTDDPEIMLFEFRSRSISLLFKLTWGGA